jgi:hypothetical protein
MNDAQLEAYVHGFMDKCASAGLSTEEAEALLLKEAKRWNLFGKVKKTKMPKKQTTTGGTAAPKSTWGEKARGAGKFLGGQAVGAGTFMGADWLINKLWPGAGGDMPQQQGPQGGGYYQQQPQRQYGHSKLNVRGLGGIKPFLT